MTRVHTFRLNLDLDQRLERIQVYNVNEGSASSPTTYFRVQDVRKKAVKLVQLTRVFGPSPGAADSGLVQAWARDLNREGRVEIAVRDYITPSVGENLSIYRQPSAHSLHFSPLQVIFGDRITIAGNGKHSPVRWEVLIKQNHAPDNRDHHEVWRWQSAQHKWACSSDCVPR